MFVLIYKARTQSPVYHTALTPATEPWPYPFLGSAIPETRRTNPKHNRRETRISRRGTC
jgi:hypothetical protein